MLSMRTLQPLQIFTAAFIGLGVSVGTCAVFGQGPVSGLPTIDEALKISQATGRPIFALAGQKT